MMMSRSVYRWLCLDSVCLCVSQVKSNVDIVSASRLLLPIRILTWQKDFGVNSHVCHERVNTKFCCLVQPTYYIMYHPNPTFLTVLIFRMPYVCIFCPSVCQATSCKSYCLCCIFIMTATLYVYFKNSFIGFMLYVA